MFLLSLSLPALAADPPVVSTALRTSVGVVNPAILLGVEPPDPDADPPDPDIADNVATARVRFSGEADFSVLLGVAERELGVRQMYVVDDAGDRVVVYGDGAVERFLPPGPCRVREGELPPGPCRVLGLGALPPGPCFEVIAVLGDGTEMGVWIAISADGGWIDPGSVVGFNPQPEPPGDFPAAVQLAFGAGSRDRAELEVSILAESGGAILPLR